MLQRIRKMLMSRLIFVLAVLLMSVPAEAGSGDKSFDPALVSVKHRAVAGQDGTLQPRGLSHAGIYALRGIAPDLTGFGVRYAVICRSINYIDGMPQNDYQPNIGHKCFEAARFNFHDQGNPTPGISPHSTAVCSILFGEDPDATLRSKLRSTSILSGSW